MGRLQAPCCDKTGLKQGSWSVAEDQKLISHIQKHGHKNWRALPKQAGLLRCGKSCRLRWLNYLRPDLKRGNFNPDEEEAIIRLHQSLGNKWAEIASQLPGRTDNEIKNIWHSYLKKRLEPKQSSEQSSAIREPSTLSPSSPASSSANSCVSYSNTDNAWEKTKEEKLSNYFDSDPANQQQKSVFDEESMSEDEGELIAYLDKEPGSEHENYGEQELAVTLSEADMDPVLCILTCGLLLLNFTARKS